MLTSSHPINTCTHTHTHAHTQSLLKSYTSASHTYIVLQSTYTTHWQFLVLGVSFSNYIATYTILFISITDYTHFCKRCTPHGQPCSKHRYYRFCRLAEFRKQAHTSEHWLAQTTFARYCYVQRHAETDNLASWIISMLAFMHVVMWLLSLCKRFHTEQNSFNRIWIPWQCSTVIWKW